MSSLSLMPEVRTAPPPPEQPAGIPPRNPLPRRILLGLLALWLLTGFYIVPTDQQAVVTRFGRVVEPRVPPGIHVSLPWLIDQVRKLKVRQLQRLVVGGEISDAVLGNTRPLISQFLTGDQNIIHLRVVAQYSVSVPADFLFQARQITDLIQAAIESELTQQIAARSVDAVLTTEKAAIQEQVRAGSQQLLDSYRAGVSVASVSIESAAPPPEAADAFRDVASARADSSRIVNEAHGYANDLIPRARGEAQRLIEEAKAYRDGRTNRAEGDASRFVQVANEYRKAERIHGHRLYAEAMEQILPKIRKLIVDGAGNIDLSIVRQQSTQPAPQAPAGAGPR